MGAEKKVKKKKKATMAEPSAAERLAALGDAFLDSIDGPPAPTRKRSQTSVAEQSGVAESSKNSRQAVQDEAVQAKRRKKKKTTQSVGTPVGKEQNPQQKRIDRIDRRDAFAELVADDRRAQGAVADRHASDKSFVGNQSARPAPRMSAAEKRRFMSGKVSDIRSRGTPPPSAGKRSSGDPEEDAEFRKTLRDVLEFVTPQLGKRERQQYEEAKIRALGGQVDARAKRPYNLLKQDAKRLGVKRQEKLEEEKQLGVSMSASNHRLGFEVDKLLKKKKEALKDKKRRREDGFLRLGMGARESRGMAVIPKSAIRNVGRRG